jgi:SpoVK/Ycf46/Vps4 family AAA+-type ATPase
MPEVKIDSIRISSSELESYNTDLFGIEEQLTELLTSSENMLTRSGEEIFRKLEIKNNLLLCGKPGVGKTRSVYWLSKKLKEFKKDFNLDLYSVKLGTILSENLGESSRNLEKLFENLREQAKDGTIIILFIDEIDSIGLSRWKITENDGIRRVLSTLFVELDKNVNLPTFIFVAATNRADLLDSALIRRFSRIIRFPEEMNKTAFEAFIRYIFDFEFSENDLVKLYEIVESLKLTPSDIKECFTIAYLNSKDLQSDLIESISDALVKRVSLVLHDETEKEIFKVKSG